MRTRALLRDDDYVTSRTNKVAPLFHGLRSSHTTDRAAASRLGVGVHLYLDWEQGSAVPPYGKRGVLANCVYDWADENHRKSDFVSRWSGLAGVWGWAPIAEAEWDFYDLADRQVGRPELRDLLSDWTSVVTSRTPRVRFIDGDHGAGKTTLVNSLLAEVVHDNPNVIAAVTSCPESAQGYGPLKELLSEIVQQRVGPKMREQEASLLLGDMLWKAPAWRDSILDGFEQAARPCARKEPPAPSAVYPDRAKHPQYLELLRMAGQTPMLLFIDNLQWADPSTLNLLLAFVKSASSEKYPIYLIVAFRHFEAHQAGAHDSDFRRFFRECLKEGSVHLLRLGDGIDVGEYLKKRYPGYELPMELLNLAEVATRGNPFLLSNLFDELDRLGKPQRLPQDQFMRLMHNWQDSLRRLLSGTSQESDKDAAPMSSIEELREKIGDAILEMRLAQLDRASLRTLLDQASVEWAVGGKGFTVEVLTKASAAEEPYVYVDLGDLEHNYLLVRTRPHSPSEADRLTLYEFWYWLYGSHIYNRVPATYRPKLHLLVAECLSVLYAGSPRVAGVLAEHFARGNELLKAGSYALQAARHEAAQSAWAMDKHWCELGLNWVETVEGHEAALVRLDLLSELAQGHYRNGDYHSASEAFQKAISVAQLAKAEPEGLARLWAWLSEAEEAQGDYPSARRAVRQGKACLRKHKVHLGEVSLWLDTLDGLLSCRADKGNLAVSALQKVLEDAKNLPVAAFSDFVRVRTYNCLGIALSYMDRYSESSAYFRMAIEVAARCGDWSMQADLKSNLAENDVYAGRFEEAEELLVEALGHARKAGDTDAIAWTLGILGNMYLESGRPTEALASLIEATQLLEQTGQHESESCIYADLALAYLSSSDCDQALKVARRARQWAETRVPRGYWLDALAQIEAGCSKPIEQTKRHFQRAIELFDQAGARHFGARSRRRLAQFLAAAGEPGHSYQLLQDALATFRMLGLPLEITRTEQLLQALGGQIIPPSPTK